MDEPKLKKKLAERVGFTFYWEEGATDGLCHYPGEPEWQMRKVEPNFPQSLDACFEWLVPNLYKQNYYYELIQWNNGQHKAIINKKTVEWATTVSDAVAETPALALCLAIEKLIDGGE